MLIRPLATMHRLVAVGVVCALHLALLAPSVGGWSSVLELDFAPEAEAIEAGERPYRDQELEYPPLSIPVIVGPALLTEDVDEYIRAFQWEMLGFDLAIVLLLGLGVQGDRRRVLGALGIYTAGVVALSGVVLGDSVIDIAPLALSRFDLVPAVGVLAAALARERGRSATWSALLATGAAVKAFPLLLFPALLRGERNLARVALAAAIPLLAAAGLVLAWGDEFGSAISHHTGRALQVESLAATPFGLAKLLGSGVGSDLARAATTSSPTAPRSRGRSRSRSGSAPTRSCSGPAGAPAPTAPGSPSPCSPCSWPSPRCSRRSSCSGCCRSRPPPTASGARTPRCSRRWC
jgi:hypothetical protein